MKRQSILGSHLSNLETGDDCCFLCGARAAPITQEHVFPKWLQQRYNLWDQRLGLLNETAIQYRNLRIPCCIACNGEALSKLESTISSAVASGYEGCAALDERFLYLWAGKLFYGVLRKELNLLRDRARPEEGRIVSEATLTSFSNLHLFLQGVRGQHFFSGTPPYSVLVCNLHDLGPRRNYCFRDSLMYMTAAIRMGEVGVIVSFEDAGLTARTYGRYITQVNGQKLHPFQFDELYARVTYQVSLMDGGVRYVTSKGTDSPRPAQTDVFDGGYLREWSQEDFSKVLRAHLSDWLKSKKQDSEWFVPPNLVPTSMTDDAGGLLLLPLSSWERRSELGA